MADGAETSAGELVEIPVRELAGMRSLEGDRLLRPRPQEKIQPLFKKGLVSSASLDGPADAPGGRPKPVEGKQMAAGLRPMPDLPRAGFAKQLFKSGVPVLLEDQVYALLDDKLADGRPGLLVDHLEELVQKGPEFLEVGRRAVPSHALEARNGHAILVVLFDPEKPPVNRARGEKPKAALRPRVVQAETGLLLLVGGGA
jgi:hypothetical protein